MGKLLYFSLLMTLVISVGACKSPFEVIRSGGKAPEQLKAADEYYTTGEYYKAQVLYELVIPQYVGQSEASEIYYKYAYTHYNLGSYLLSAYYFNRFAQTFPNSPRREEADYMAAYSNYQLSPNYRLDQSYSLKAIEDFQLFINTYPTSDKVAEANQLIDEMRLKLEDKAFKQGRLYFDLAEYQSAIVVFENLLKDYPETKDAERVRYLIVRSAYLLAQNSILSKQEERFEKTVSAFDAFKNKYPSSQYLDEASRMKDLAQVQLKQIRNDGY